MIAVQAHFKNEYMDLLIDQRTLLATIDDVKKYINDIDVDKVGVVTFKMKMPNKTRVEIYTYVAIFNTIIKGNFGILYDVIQRDKYRFGVGVFGLLSHYFMSIDKKEIVENSCYYTELRKTNPTIYNFFSRLCTTCDSVKEAIDECKFRVKIKDQYGKDMVKEMEELFD